MTIKRKPGRPHVKEQKKVKSVRCYESDLRKLKMKGITIQQLLDDAIKETLNDDLL